METHHEKFNRDLNVKQGKESIVQSMPCHYEYSRHFHFMKLTNISTNISTGRNQQKLSN